MSAFSRLIDGYLQLVSITNSIAPLLSWTFARDVATVKGNPFESTAKCLFMPLVFFPPSTPFSECDSPVRTLWLSMTATVGCGDFPCLSLARAFSSQIRRSRRAAAAEETDLTKSFYYFSPDPDILTVDQTGTVTVRKEGEGRIWAYVLDGSDRKVEIGVNKFALEDFNHDGVIDSDDLQMLVNHIANPAESKIPSEKADLTKDGGVDSDDIQYHVNKIISK